MTNLAVLATRYAGRPLLLTPRAAQELALRIHEIDARALSRPSRLQALLRTLSGGSRQPMAMEDDDYPAPEPMEARLAYHPLYAGEVEDIGYGWSLKDHVALLEVATPLLDRGEDYCGTVYHGYDTLLHALREAMSDERVRGVFIRMNSPGGVVAGGLPALAKFMRENREAAGGKPIWIYADMACSAAYWITASGDRVIGPKEGLVSSIGAVIVHESVAAWLEKNGIEITPIQFGAKKTAGAWWEKLSPEARADLQAEIDQCGRNFVADVIAGRPMLTEEAVLATEAGVFMCHHDEPERSGLDLRLVDAIASEEEAFAELVAKVANPVSAPNSGQSAAAARGQRGATTPKEEPMAGKAQPTGRRAALASAITKAKAEVKRLEAEAEQANAEEREEDAPAEDDAQPAAETEEVEEGGDAEGGDAPSDGEDDEVDAKEAKAILDLPEAKGREALAKELAFTPGMTAKRAKTLLAAAAKTSSLASEMSGSRRLGADAPAPKSAASRLDPKSVYAKRAERRKQGGR